MKDIKGVIFDFNGVLVFDSELHEKAWWRFISKYIDKDESCNKEKILESIHGRTNAEIIKNYCGVTANIAQLSDQKETMYRELCESEEMFCLSSGSIELLNWLKGKSIPFTIATSAGLDNLDFYYQKFELEKWFEKESVIFNDGSLASKPDPAFYQAAASKLGMSPSECCVLEDSIAGLQAANNSGAGCIFSVGTSNKISKNPLVSKFIDKHLNTLDEFPYQLFNR